MELLPPVTTLLLQQFSGQPLSLPRGVVGVLHRQLRQSGQFQSPVGRIKPFPFLKEQSQRPLVHDAVMEGDPQHMFILGQCDPHDPPQGSLCQIKRTARLLQQPRFQSGLFLAGRHGLQVHLLPGQRNLFPGGNLLHQALPL